MNGMLRVEKEGFQIEGLPLKWPTKHTKKKLLQVRIILVPTPSNESKTSRVRKYIRKKESISLIFQFFMQCRFH